MKMDHISTNQSDSSNIEVMSVNRPMVIRYSEEEDPPVDERFLKLYGTINRYSRPRKKRAKKRKETVQNIDIYYI